MPDEVLRNALHKVFIYSPGLILSQYCHDSTQSNIHSLYLNYVLMMRIIQRYALAY